MGGWIESYVADAVVIADVRIEKGKGAPIKCFRASRANQARHRWLATRAARRPATPCRAGAAPRGGAAPISWGTEL